MEIILAFGIYGFDCYNALKISLRREPMSEQNEKSIKDMFKQAFEMWEKSAAEQFERLVRSQTFLSAITQNLEQTLNISNRVKDITQTTMGMMNLPTKRDMDNLAKQVRSIRMSLEEINERLEDMSKISRPAPVPKNTRKTLPKREYVKKEAARREPKTKKTSKTE